MGSHAIAPREKLFRVFPERGQPFSPLSQLFTINSFKEGLTS